MALTRTALPSRTLNWRPSSRQLGMPGAVLRSPALAVVVCGFLLLAHLGWSNSIYPTEARVGAALLGMLALLAIRAASPERLPFLPLAAVQFYLHFGVPTFYEQRLLTLSGPAQLSDASLNAAVGAALLSFALMYLMAFPGRAFGRLLEPRVGKTLPRTAISRHATGIRVWSVAALIAHVVISLRPNWIPESLAFAVGTLFSPIVPQVLSFLLWRETRSNADRLVFLAVTGITAFLGIMSGMLQSAFTPLFVALVVSWTSSGKVRVGLVAGLVLAFLVLNPAKHAYRARAWKAEDATMAEKVELWTSAVESTWTDRKVEVSDNLKGSADRVSSLLYVAHTLEWVPRYVPFAGAERWWPIVYSYVPRFLWPGKPDLTGMFNRNYTVAFRLQTEEGTATTTIHLPQMSDAYWAFGWLGVGIAGAMVGFLFGLYEGAFATVRWPLTAVGMLFLTRLQSTSHLGANYTGVIQIFIAGGAALWAVAAITAVNRVRSSS